MTWAATPINTLVSVRNQVAVLSVFLCVRAVVRSRDDLSIVAAGYVLGCVYAVYLVITENAISSLGIELADVRYGLAGVNLNYLAYSLITGVIVIFLLWRHRFLRLPLLTAGGTIAVGSWLAASRGVALAGLCLVAWLLIYRLAPARSFRFLGLVVVPAAIAVPAELADSLLRQIEGGTSRATGDLSGRLTTWPIAREVFGEDPLIGIGAGGFAGVNPYGIGAHDVVLEIGTGMGIVGLCLFLGTLYTALIKSTRTLEVRRRCLLVGSLIAVWT
jgi:O-antigen ligase